MKNIYQFSVLIFIFNLFNLSLFAENAACDTPPTGLRIVTKGHTYFHIVWDDNHAGDYEFRIRPKDGIWFEKRQISEKIFIKDLTPCTEYELQVSAICSPTPSDFSESLIVKTNGCDDTYCHSYGLVNDRYIRSFSFNDMINNSGNNYGYGDYTKLFTKVKRNNSYDIRIQPIEPGYGDYIKIWIDFNGDNDFEDEGELVKDIKVYLSERYIYSQILIPANAALGVTRIRISLSDDEHAESCDTRGYREIEDYTLVIEGDGFTANLEEVDVHYDITRISTECRIPEEFEVKYIGYSLVQFDWKLNGSEDYQVRFREPNTNKGNWVYTSWLSVSAVNLILTPCSEYEVQVRNTCDGYLSEHRSEFSQSIFFTTKGCDDAYCYSYGINGRWAWGANWIERFKLNTLNNNSGNNGGYANFTEKSTILEKGKSYEIDILPGYFRFDTYTTVWIDFNQDNDFNNEEELVFQNIDHGDDWILGDITIPTNALNGETRMRVSMGLFDYSAPCDTKGYRDVEDYTVIIEGEEVMTTSNNNTIINEDIVTIYPNPATSSTTLKLNFKEAATAQIKLTTLNRQEVFQQSVPFQQGEHDYTIPLDNISNGIYFIHLISEGGSVLSKKLVVAR